MPRRFVGFFEQIISLADNLIAELIMTVGIGREGGMGLNLIQEGMEKATPVTRCFFIRHTEAHLLQSSFHHIPALVQYQLVVFC